MPPARPLKGSDSRPSLQDSLIIIGTAQNQSCPGQRNRLLAETLSNI